MSELHNNNERDVELYRGWDLMRKVRSCLVWVNVVYFYRVFHLDLNTDGRLHEHYLDDYKHDVPLLQTGSSGLDAFLLTQFDVVDSFYVSWNIYPVQLKWPPKGCRRPLRYLSVHLKNKKMEVLSISTLFTMFTPRYIS